MSPFRSHDFLELRGVESRSLDKLRVLAIASQRTLAGAIDAAVLLAGGDVRNAGSIANLPNAQFERVLVQATPRPGMHTPRPLGPVDTNSLTLLHEIMLSADITLPQALTSALTVADIMSGGADRRIADLSAGELHNVLERVLATAQRSS